MLFFLLLAIIGFVTSLIVHFSTFCGIDPQEIWPQVWLMHVGIFVVFVPAIILQKRTGARNFRRIAPFAPGWMQTGIAILFAYAIFNFVVFAVRMSGTPAQLPNGTYELHNHGRFIRAIGADEYHYFRALELRGFSGHWMLFYGLSAMILASAWLEGTPPPSTNSTMRIAPIRGGFGVPIWLHSTLVLFATMVGWIGTPIAVYWLYHSQFRRVGGYSAAAVMLGSAIGGVILLPRIVRRLIPARCAECGGRAMPLRGRPIHYRCSSCGTEQVIGRSRV